MSYTMRAVTSNHIRWRAPITIKFGFSGIDPLEAASLVRSRLKKQFPTLDKPSQCVYVVRLTGSVAIAYGDEFSPVIYIGEGNAATRLYGHASWIAELLIAVPNAEIEVRVADCVRTNDTNLCQCVEADLLVSFIEKYSCLPWFNRQRENKFSGKREYEKEVSDDFMKRIGKVQGSRYLWAIRPTSNNDHYIHYTTGQYG
jgi:hypothetical protein